MTDDEEKRVRDKGGRWSVCLEKPIREYGRPSGD
jgi:hypothetical protein